MRFLGHLALVALLTVLTQIGGLAWLLAMAFRRRMIAFLVVYAALSAAAFAVAPAFGRVALPCIGAGSFAMHSPLYCVLNRHYAVPEMAAVLGDVAERMEAAHPGTRLRILDAGFPFLDGFPLLPHLSHDDGRKADLALLHRDDGRAPVAATPSPIGYFAFEEGPTHCPQAWPTLRWDLPWLQRLWPDLPLDEARTGDLVRALTADERVIRILIEPHLRDRLGLRSPKVRFQGCRAARHDDHIHIEV